MACWRCGLPQGPIEPNKAGFRPRSPIAGIVTIPIRPFVTSFPGVQISFSVLTVQGIFTEMDTRTFPGPSLDDQIRTCSAYRRAQPASLPAGCREHCERDSR